MESRCPICREPATKICSGCHLTSYCSLKHQKSDWKVHKKSCRWFEIECNEQLGRYTIAARDIPAGTIIMNESPIMIGPKQDTIPVCLGCNKNLNEDKKYYCSQCLIFPMCGPECEKIQIHAENECKIFMENKPSVKAITNFTEVHPVYDCIMTLRCLRLKETDPKKWKKLTNMTHLIELRKTKLPELWHRNEINIVRFLRDDCGMNQFSETEIHQVLGYYYTNSFEVKLNRIVTSGHFDNIFLMAHDCAKNTHHTFSEDYKMVVRTTVPIKKGDSITVTYAYICDGTLQRRKYLSESKFFDCACRRCSDPTELGTYFSAISCKKCQSPDGYLLPANSLCNSSDWNCSKCDFYMSADEILALLNKLEEEITSVKEYEPNVTDHYENLLKKYSKSVLHPNHFLMIYMESNLLSMYGKKKGFLIKDLSLELLERKEALCRHVLSVLAVIEPGLSRVRGRTLYELHAAVYFIAEKKFQKNKISAAELKERMLEVLKLLEESKTIISFDSTSTTEGSLVKTITSSIAFIKESVDKL